MKKYVFLFFATGLMMFLIAAAGSNSADPLSVCRTAEKVRGGILGTASITGEPWVYKSIVTQKWDDATLSYKEVAHELQTLRVPGDTVRVYFSNSQPFTWDGSSHAKTSGSAAENLLVVSQMLEVPGQFTVWRRDGSIVLVSSYVRGVPALQQCRGITLQPASTEKGRQ